MSFLRKRGEHKGENGRVLVIGGSKDYVGAPALVGLAALRSGVDWVTIAAPEKVAWAINSISPDIITKKFSGDFFVMDDAKEIIELADNFDVIIIGNGLGLEPSTQDFVKEVVTRIPKPKVIDADAIKALHNVKIDNAILTPHSKEFEIFSKEKLPDDVGEKARIVQTFAKERTVILLKGKDDIIASKDDIKYNTTGNNGMTISGTGDVLAGLVGGLLAQSGDLVNSAYYAAYINGRIGDYLMRKKDYGFTASDMVELIPVIKRKYL